MNNWQQLGIGIDENGIVVLSDSQLRDLEANAKIVTAGGDGSGTNNSPTTCGGNNTGCRNTAGCDGSTNEGCTNGSYIYKCKAKTPL